MKYEKVMFRICSALLTLSLVVSSEQKNYCVTVLACIKSAYTFIP